MTGATTEQIVPSRVRVRPVRAEDVPWLVEIEQASFAAGWPLTAFAHELQENASARYVVVEHLPGAGAGRAALLGFAGLWLMLEEAHVVTVAVSPAYRRLGLGRLLVHALLLLARDEGMTDATLECRVSNEAARALYRKYGFHEVGLRKRYYADNAEDAVIMTTVELSSAGYHERLRHLAGELQARLPGAIVAVAAGQ